MLSKTYYSYLISEDMFLLFDLDILESKLYDSSEFELFNTFNFLFTFMISYNS